MSKKIAFFIINQKKRDGSKPEKFRLSSHLCQFVLKIFLFLKIEGRDLFIVSLKHCKYIPQPQK